MDKQEARLGQLVGLLFQSGKFALVGGLGAGINASLFAALVSIQIHYAVASLIAWTVSLGIGYVLNRKFTFRSQSAVARSLPRVVLVYVAQQLFALSGITILVEIFHINPIAAYIAMMPPAIVLSFLAMRTFAFR
jgi:putative flippase GtrA